MKKIILTTTLAFIGLITILVACKKEESSSDSSKIISTQLAITTTTSSLSDFSRKLGISEIQLVDSNPTNIKYKLVANSMNFNGVNDYTLNNKELVFTSEGANIVMTFVDGKSIIYDPNTKDYTLSCNGNAVSLESSNFDISFNNFSTEVQNEFAWGVFVFEEIRNENLTRNPRTLNKLSSGRWTAVRIGTSRNSLTADCNKWIEGFLRDNPGCAQVGSLDVSCLWDNHGCIGTAEFDC